MYVQYTDPAGYPPLDHSAQILARDGWDVLFAGIEAHGTAGLELTPHDRIRVVRAGGRSGGMWGPLKYAQYHLRVAGLARAFRPDWIYASDSLAASPARLAARVGGARLLYHEHDIPTRGQGKLQQRADKARSDIVARAELLVAPGAERAAAFGEHGRRAHVVWNCPLQNEVRGAERDGRDEVRLVYAGSITPPRLPFSWIEALSLLPSHVELEIFGYATIGHPQYVQQLLDHARQSGVGERVHYRGVIARRELLAELAKCDIGIATLDLDSGDGNIRSMIGPSNKPFDYMACGLPMVVTEQPDWRATFVEPGFAAACQPRDPRSIAAAVSVFLDAETRGRVGDSARTQIATAWNYERQFAPVLEALSN